MMRSTRAAGLQVYAASIVVLLCMLVQAPGSAVGAIDNVAFQWTTMLNTLICPNNPPLTSSIQAQLHLAQWHALLAVKAAGEGKNPG